MTKQELEKRLWDEERLGAILPLTKTRNFTYYKADAFSVNEDIIYIADSQRAYEVGLWMDAVWDFPEELMKITYTGYDFMAACWGNEERAKTLFGLVDGRTLTEILLPDEKRSLSSAVLKEMAVVDKLFPDIDKEDAAFLDKYKPWLGLQTGDLYALAKKEKWFGLDEDSNFPADNESLNRFLAIGGDDNTKVTFRTMLEMGKLVMESTDEYQWELHGLEGIITEIFMSACYIRMSIPPKEDKALLADYRRVEDKRLRDKVNPYK